jgi:hypothetical protein
MSKSLGRVDQRRRCARGTLNNEQFPQIIKASELVCPIPASSQSESGAIKRAQLPFSRCLPADRWFILVHGLCAAHECFICWNFSLDRDRQLYEKVEEKISASCAFAKDSELASDLRLSTARACSLQPGNRLEHAVPKVVWDGHIARTNH